MAEEKDPCRLTAFERHRAEMLREALEAKQHVFRAQDELSRALDGIDAAGLYGENCYELLLIARSALERLDNEVARWVDGRKTTRVRRKR